MDEAIDNCQHGVKGEISPMKERTVMLFWTCMISLFCVCCVQNQILHTPGFTDKV